ncbi:MAG: amidohydrolase [Flavobacteriaceae bacterium CG_4_8_14_3_um_filter_34_10]|nr:amidohydrolase [Flavobacteriia bacterium]OIP49334.1 MAG: amidohydrolase [Flavobacteriaceae bacterium CG2_30_34_30]PIQ19452.1 MAG: amidohydrolase [Flavobacteriaceae bacterium CG18_big_fil_WC_8_21_14_2_50_34_36]PIV50093.1 MAG: amidohydrolase [Flavobacteriaceae bacterium CG02_land_8_20_14_3_00_34_13]PIX09143.1 MAG: amidohydrolase [Flavobacteriaceae bacterium CG_4_8_14_3_um_filter_34_10]PIZ08267.1 MAG: amidohydrolase [Flavobacteriaceae bacterium CG_4_10_14_0_8_um_filter_34_31]PJC06239.1 MAG: a
MNKFTLLFAFAFIFFSCDTKQQADILVINANIYTVNDSFEMAESFAITDGKIVEVGTTQDIQKKYKAAETYDFSGKTIVPGFIDAHAHFYGLGLNQNVIDLVGAASFDEVVSRIVAFQKEKQLDFLEGHGWNQNLWEVKEFPNKEKLDSLFPETPIVLTRIDGHAYLVNQKALDLAAITTETKVEGGIIEVKDGKLTGILIDGAMDLIAVISPTISKEVATKALKDAQEICFSFGLTTVNDAGLDRRIIELIDTLQQASELDIRLYAMVSNSPENLEYYLSKGIIKTDKLHVRSIKVYADGALGSRGAALKEPYSDHPGHYGLFITPVSEIHDLAKRIAKSAYQMNTHAIGDSANSVVLNAYTDVLGNTNDRRWKVEHAQVVSEEDFHYFKNGIIPSVQPTHATSDMYWAEDRVGKERIKGAYAYKKLLDIAGIVALGTDFPVEHVSPFYTFYAATARKDLKHFPEGGFQKQDALSREETLKGMTIWAAYSNFEEKEKGSIEAGKFADFIILNKDIMTVAEDEIPNLKVEATFVGGKLVFKN